jgi:WD40 repeat protein
VLTDPMTRGITSETFTPGGKSLATADADHHAFLWDLAQGKIVELLPARRAQALRALAISSDGRRLAMGDAQGAIHIADITRIGISVHLTAP